MDAIQIDAWRVEALDAAAAGAVEGGRSRCPIPDFRITLPVEPILIELPPVYETFRLLE